MSNLPSYELAHAMGDDDANTQHCLNTLIKLPESFHQLIADKYFSKLSNKNRDKANLELINLEKEISSKGIQLAGDDIYLRNLAKNRSNICKTIAGKIKNETERYEVLASGVRRLEMKPPLINKKCSLRGAIKRLCDEKWWRREARSTQARLIEGLAIKLGKVHRLAQIYVSDDSVHRRSLQLAQNKKMLSEMVATNEYGQSFTLEELAELGISNPVNQRNELMVRISGFEQLARSHDHVGEFYTLTCPSCMHARLSSNGKPNPKYDDSTPKESQAYLCKIWARIRAKLHRDNIRVYGIRVTEPNHDGTPHWHILMFMPKEHVQTVRQIIRHHALQMDGDERGAFEHRVKIVPIDPNKGSAAGYIAKYIAKNIDGAHLSHGIYGEDPIEASQRVDVWKATWGIRQFQQIGGPSVSIWRELRRVRSVSPDITGDLFSAWKAADNGDWAGFVMATGGIAGDITKNPITLAVQWNDKLGTYGDPVGFEIFGVESGSMLLFTSRHEWTIERTASAEDLSAYNSTIEMIATKSLETFTEYEKS